MKNESRTSPFRSDRQTIRRVTVKRTKHLVPDFGEKIITVVSRLAIASLLFLVPLISHAFGSISGTYVADNRPREILFLTLTQSGNTLAGSLTIVTPDSNGGTAAGTQDLTGIVDGDHVDLKSYALHFNGSRTGSTLLLSASTTNGYRVTYHFASKNEDAFNQVLTEWRRGLASAHERAIVEAAAQASEREAITKLSHELTADINNIKNTGIPTDLSDMEHAISDQRTAIEQMKNDLLALKRDAEATPMTCYQAYQVVGYDYSQKLGYDYRSTLGYSISTYQNAKGNLEKRLANVPDIVAKVTKDAAALQQALRTKRYQSPTPNVSPNDAKDLAVKYQAMASDAQSRLPQLQTEVDNIVEQAKQLIAEGKSVAQGAQSSVACNHR